MELPMGYFSPQMSPAGGDLPPRALVTLSPFSLLVVPSLPCLPLSHCSVWHTVHGSVLVEVLDMIGPPWWLRLKSAERRAVASPCSLYIAIWRGGNCLICILLKTVMLIGECDLQISQSTLRSSFPDSKTKPWTDLFSSPERLLWSLTLESQHWRAQFNSTSPEDQLPCAGMYNKD